MSENNEEIKTKLKKCREEFKYVKEDYRNMSRDPTSEEFQTFTLQTIESLIQITGQTIESLIQITDLLLNHNKFE